jgi:hypothetical protein
MVLFKTHGSIGMVLFKTQEPDINFNWSRWHHLHRQEAAWKFLFLYTQTIKDNKTRAVKSYIYSSMMTIRVVMMVGNVETRSKKILKYKSEDFLISHRDSM